MLAASVVLEKTAYSYDRLYAYTIPQELSFCRAGCRVTVPFGRGNSVRQGIVLSVGEAETDKELKSIISVQDNEPVLSEEMLKMCVWIRERTFCTYYDAVRAVLPPGLSFKVSKTYYVVSEADDTLTDDERVVYQIILSNPNISEDDILKVDGIKNYPAVIKSLIEKGIIEQGSKTRRKTGDATRKIARLLSYGSDKKLTNKQSDVIECLLSGPLSVKELMYYTGVSQSVISTLAKNGIIELYEEEVFRAPYERKSECIRSEIELNETQNKSYEGLNSLYCADKPSVALLYGVTGSGKTKVYLKLVDKAVDEGKNVIVMVPEISLTPQTLKIFNERYGDKIALFHSAMSSGQRLDEWKRVKSGKAKVAIGTRSAVFAPFDNVGLIIIDEEQEHTYKSEQSPRFDARELAKFRVNENKALLILASATPSVESFSAAKNGRYSLFSMPERYGGGELPEVYVVDMKKEILSGNRMAISSVLREKLSETIQNGNQAILLLNRRGHNSFISCPSCGEVETCPNCSISLTYHSANKRLMCHYCGYSVPFTSHCSKCGSEHIRLMGMGTQLVEEELRGLFPKANVLRMDADSTMAKSSYSNLLSNFAAGKYDIMLGTQMVAKGLDFPNVSLVGVIGADQAMYSDDYRSYEKTFSLLTQVVGRSGRSGTKGSAVIQTVSPDSSIIKLASSQDYEAFYNEEIMTRKLMVYPPYCDIAVVAVSSEDRAISELVCRDVFDNIKKHIDSDYKGIRIVILGPAAASIPKVGGRYRTRMIIKCKDNKMFRDLLRLSVLEADSKNRGKDYSLYIDIDPERII